MSALREHIEKWSRGRAPDVQEMGERLANNWDLTVARLETLHANDVTAEPVLREAGGHLQVLTTTFGPLAGWTLAQHHVLHRTACRVWGPKQQVVPSPGRTEQF